MANDSPIYWALSQVSCRDKCFTHTGSLHSPDDPKVEYCNLHFSGSFRKVICSASHTFRGHSRSLDRNRRNTKPTKKLLLNFPRFSWFLACSWPSFQVYLVFPTLPIWFELSPTANIHQTTWYTTTASNLHSSCPPPKCWCTDMRQPPWP